MSCEELREGIPGSTLHTLDQFLIHGWPPNGFVRAVLENNLFGAFSQADEANRRAIEGIVRYVYNCFPAACYGSFEDVKGWLRCDDDTREAVLRGFRRNHVS